MRVLHVDDESDVREIVQLSLELDKNLVVKCFSSAQDAITALAQWRPDVILLDVMMPGLDGSEVAARLQDSPTMKNIPVVFLTAAVKKAEVGAREGTIGGLPYLAKPVDIDEVVACIEKHLRA